MPRGVFRWTLVYFGVYTDPIIGCQYVDVGIINQIYRYRDRKYNSGE